MKEIVSDVTFKTAEGSCLRPLNVSNCIGVFLMQSAGAGVTISSQKLRIMAYNDGMVELGITRALEGGEGRFCPPLMFFEDIKKTNCSIFTRFSVPDQK